MKIFRFIQHFGTNIHFGSRHKALFSKLVILFALLGQKVLAQEAVLFPPNHFVSTLYTHTPIKSDLLTLSAAEVFATQQTGVFSELRSGRAQIHMRKNRTRIRFSAENNQEGPVIKSSNAYIGLGSHIAISPKYILAAEGDVGIVSMQLGDPQAGDQSADSDLDLKFKAILYSQTHYFECNIIHINKPTIQPVLYSIEYPVGFNAIYKISYHFLPDLSAKTLVAINRDFSQNLFTAGEMLNYRESVSLGIAVQSSGDVTVLSDYQFRKASKYPISLIIAYQAQALLKSETPFTPLFHVGIKTSLHDKKE